MRLQQVQDQALNELRRRGLRLTPQREAIYCYLRSTVSHPRAEDVYSSVRSEHPSLSLATVYNTLNLLVNQGLAIRLAYGESTARYDANVSDHAHVVCEHCGSVADVHPASGADIQAAVAAASGYRIRSHRLMFYGVCGPCQEQGY